MIAAIIPPGAHGIGVGTRHTKGDGEAQRARNLQSFLFRINATGNDADPKVAKRLDLLLIAG